MHWKIVEGIIHDHSSHYCKDEVVAKEEALLKEITDNTLPLFAAKVAYALALVYLKAEETNVEKIERYVSHLKSILDHEIESARELGPNEMSLRTLYLRKLSEHLFHHLHLIALDRGIMMVIPEIERIRGVNHEELLKIQNHDDILRAQEESLLETVLGKSVFVAGLFIAAGMFFAWSSGTELMQYASANVLMTEPPAVKIPKMIEAVVLFVFSLGIIWSFWKACRKEKA